MFANIVDSLKFIQRPPASNGTRGRTLADLALLSWMAADYADQEAHYVALRKWHEGDYTIPLTDRQEQYLNRDSQFKFCINYLPLPVDLAIERLNVVGFEGPEGIGGEDGLLWQWWQANRMDALQRQLTRAAAVDGDTYLLVEWDNERGMPTFHHENAYDGSEGVKVHYLSNTRRKMTFASKRWIENRLDEAAGKIERVIRLNIYTETEIRKYIESGRGWVEYPDEDGRWPIRWDAGVIPVVHFRWKDNGGNWGESELENLIPVQMSLNKAILDEAEARDRTAFQIITLTGGKVPDDLQIDPSKVLFAENPAASWGSIPAGNLAELREAINDHITRLAQLAHIPLQYFQVTGQIASAATQRADDSQLVAKVASEAVSLANAWEDVMHIALRLNEVFGNGRALSIQDATEIQTQWDSFDRVDKVAEETARAEMVEALVRAGASLPGALEQAEYTDEEIATLSQLDTVTGIEQ
jgi:hypothetical protein